MTQIVRTDHDPAQRLLDVLQKPTMQNAIRKALPEHVKPDRVLRMLTTAIRATPKLSECHPGSFVGSVLQVTQLGLEPNTPLGQAFLVPFWNTKQNCYVCTPIIGYKGMIELAHRSGRVQVLKAMVAREGDEFTYEESFVPDFRFVRNAPLAAKLTHAWCFGTTTNGGRFLEVLERQDVLARKARSQAVKKGWTSPWSTDEDKMWRKTAVRAAQWQLPQSAEMQRAECLSRAEDGDLAWADAYDPMIAGLLDEAHMLPPEPDGPPLDGAIQATATETSAPSRDNDLSR